MCAWRRQYEGRPASRSRDHGFGRRGEARHRSPLGPCRRLRGSRPRQRWTPAGLFDSSSRRSPRRCGCLGPRRRRTPRRTRPPHRDSRLEPRVADLRGLGEDGRRGGRRARGGYARSCRCRPRRRRAGGISRRRARLRLHRLGRSGDRGRRVRLRMGRHRSRRRRGGLHRSRCGSRRPGWIRRSSCRQQGKRIDVALLVSGGPDPEVHVRLGGLGVPARTHSGHRGAFGHRVPFPHADRPEVLQRHRVPVGGHDRKRPAALRDGARERDQP